MKMMCQWCKREFEDGRADPLQYDAILCPYCHRFTKPIKATRKIKE